MSEEEKQKKEKEEEESLFVNTAFRGQRKIEIVGVEKSYNWRNDISRSLEVACQNMKISKVGPVGDLKQLIPNCQYLYLDKNLLSNWDQFFLITKQLRFLHTLTLSENRFARIDKSYMDDKNVDELINPHLKVLVLIGMHLDWSQIDIISPTLTYVEELHLCRNNCKIISSAYDISKDVWRHLKYINLEENNIDDWEEIQGFRKLEKVKKLGLGINQIKEIRYRPGFSELTTVDIYENLIDNWESIDQLNEYKEITRLRIADNPLTSGENKDKARQQILARMKYLQYYNGSKVGEREKADCELYYIKQCYKEFCDNNGGIDKGGKVNSLEDPKLGEYMSKHHPRFYELVEKLGFNIETFNEQKEDAEVNIKSKLVQVKLISKVDQTQGKILKKKLLPTMTVESLKGLCCKLFKADMLTMKLTFRDSEDSEVYYDIEENLRQLSFYGITNG